MEKLLRTMRHRMTWTNAKKILNANGVSTGNGWDGTLKKVAASSEQVEYGRLEDALVEHLLCGEKYTKLYPIPATKRETTQHNHFNQERHFYSRDNFKLNRAAALTEWRQLLSA